MEQFKSTTNNLIYILTFSIIGMTSFTLIYYPDTLFKDVFAVFAPLLTGIWGYKFGRSLPEQKEVKPTLVEEKKEDNFVV
jgi:hypothetical protein